jgi:hypothetical protein
VSGAIEDKLDGTTVDWIKKVSDEQYHQNETRR